MEEGMGLSDLGADLWCGGQNHWQRVGLRMEGSSLTEEWGLGKRGCAQGWWGRARPQSSSVKTTLPGFSYHHLLQDDWQDLLMHCDVVGASVLHHVRSCRWRGRGGGGSRVSVSSLTVSGLCHVTRVTVHVIPSAPWLLFGLHVPHHCWWWAVMLLAVGDFVTVCDGWGCSISSYPNPMRGPMFPDPHM